MIYTAKIDIHADLNLTIEGGRLSYDSDVTVEVDPDEFVGELDADDRASLLSALLLRMGVGDISTTFREVEKESSLALTVGVTDD